MPIGEVIRDLKAIAVLPGFEPVYMRDIEESRVRMTLFDWRRQVASNNTAACVHY